MTSTQIVLTIFMCFKHKTELKDNLPRSVADKIPARFQ